MAKENKMRVKDSPCFFERAQCSECKEFGVELMKHKFSDILTCVECVNDQLIKMQSEEEIEPEGYYSDYSYNQLVQERNE